MKKIKLIIPMLLTVVSLSSIPVVATEITPCSIDNETTISPLAEKVEWVYRMYNGILQKRLWSNTNECWLTDWIDCE